MKHYIIILASLCLLSFAKGPGEIEIPESIKRTFEQKFPNAIDVKWESDTDSHYEVGFILDGKEKTAVFTLDGNFKEIETEIKNIELPKRVLKSIEKKFPLSKVSFAQKIQRANNVVVYEVEVNTGIEEIDITLDQYGFEVD
ncbi:MAG: PepSY-like domain-containing protein [Sphingobacteriaceae bacterium]|jgi:hypothetical protein